MAEMDEAIPIIEGRAYFLCSDKVCVDDSETHYFSVDSQFVYYPVNKENGPLSLNYIYRFCTLFNAKLKNIEFRHKRIVLVTTSNGPKRSCAAVLVGAYLILCVGLSTQDTARKFMGFFPPLTSFIDSSDIPNTYELTVYDCVCSIFKAMQKGLFDLQKFNLREYEYYDMAENGDINWIIPEHIMAFSSPADSLTKDHPFLPSNYVGYFKKHGVSLVVRLCSPMYDKSNFTKYGIDVVDLVFPDGGTPNDAILYRFIKLMRQRRKGEDIDVDRQDSFMRNKISLSTRRVSGSSPVSPGVAIHCKAGLGRTGTLVGCYLMSDYGFTPKEAIGYIRMARPGSIVADQQTYLELIYKRLQNNMLEDL